MPGANLEERIHDVEAALEEEQVQLATGSSVDSIRSSTGPGLAMLPYLTINDIIVLNRSDITELEEIEERLLEIPEQAWDHVLDLVRARVVQVEPHELRGRAEESED